MTESIKIVLLGETAVGKTSIIQRFITDSFNSNCISSLSAQFNSKTMEINGETLKIDIWDTAGQEKYRSLARIFYKDAKVIVFVYDITNKKTFEEIKNYWFPQTKDNCENNVIYALVGNKNDLYEKEEVNEIDAINYAKEINAVFTTASALSNVGINSLFETLGQKLINKDNNNNKIENKVEIVDNNNKSIKLSKNDEKEIAENKKCCGK
jgi:small GTP-binding protein